MADAQSAAYRRVQNMISADECVLLDGGVSTELQRVGIKDHRISDKRMWGTWALYHAPEAVLEVHKRFVKAECDVISTNTWAILNAPELEARSTLDDGSPTHWMDAARLAIQLARRVVDTSGRKDKCAIAFSMNGEIDTAERHATLRLLMRVFEEDPPDLILLETLSLIREDLTFRSVELLVESGIPVWLSFRRCRHGVCGVHGQHWGGPEGDLFGRAAHRFEKIGVDALLINCLPASHVPGILPWLRDFTDMPLGVYPNLGRYLDPGWSFDDEVGPKEYASMALEWRSEGAQIVGGCCGVTAPHLKAARKALRGTKRGTTRATPALDVQHDAPEVRGVDLPVEVNAWRDTQNRDLYPLAVPELKIDPGVFEPTEGSFLIWKHLFRSGIGERKRCLDVGCGSGILTIQLALNGAKWVHAIDVQREATINTMANAYRNGVESRVQAAVEDLYTFSPVDSYDLICASLYQMPVDPYSEPSGHRSLDYWGRNLIDHLITILPKLLTPTGTAYILQLSILGQRRTAQLLDEHGFSVKVADFDTFSFTPMFLENMEQIHRVEQLSDAYHLTLGKSEVMVAYLLEVTWKKEGQ